MRLILQLCQRAQWIVEDAYLAEPCDREQRRRWLGQLSAFGCNCRRGEAHQPPIVHEQGVALIVLFWWRNCETEEIKITVACRLTTRHAASECERDDSWVTQRADQLAQLGICRYARRFHSSPLLQFACPAWASGPAHHTPQGALSKLES